MFLPASQHHKRQVFQLFRMSPKHTLKLAAFSTNFPASCAMVSWAALDQNRQNEWSTASALKLLSAGFPQQTKWAARNTPFCGPSPSLQPTSTHRNACCMFWFTLFLCQLPLLIESCVRALIALFESVPLLLWVLFLLICCACTRLQVMMFFTFFGSPLVLPSQFLLMFVLPSGPRAGLYAGANPGPISPIARDDMLIIHQGQFAKGRSW